MKEGHKVALSGREEAQSQGVSRKDKTSTRKLARVRIMLLSAVVAVLAR